MALRFRYLGREKKSDLCSPFFDLLLQSVANRQNQHDL